MTDVSDLYASRWCGWCGAEVLVERAELAGWGDRPPECRRCGETDWRDHDMRG